MNFWNKIILDMRSYMQEEIVSKENSNNIGKSKETLMKKCIEWSKPERKTPIQYTV